jgi:hypothetical protein
MAATEPNWNATPFTREVYEVSVEWERLGWLLKYRDQHNREWWDLTPLGRRKLGMPPLLRQKQ